MAWTIFPMAFPAHRAAFRQAHGLALAFAGDGCVGSVLLSCSPSCHSSRLCVKPAASFGELTSRFRLLEFRSAKWAPVGNASRLVDGKGRPDGEALPNIFESAVRAGRRRRLDSGQQIPIPPNLLLELRGRLPDN